MASLSAQLLDELGYDPDDPDDPDNGLPELSGSAGARGRRLASELPPGAMLAARIGARRVAVARLGSGRLVVVADACPHDGGRISDGFVDGERLVCARHGWELTARRNRCERAASCGNETNC
jgi:nitrite reductase/ring-hydroxylating ferredoxin subunit